MIPALYVYTRARVCVCEVHVDGDGMPVFPSLLSTQTTNSNHHWNHQTGAQVPTSLPAGADGRVINAALEVAGRTWQVRTRYVVGGWEDGSMLSNSATHM